MTAAASWTESESRVYRAHREHLEEQLGLAVRHATLAVDRALEVLQELTELDGPQDPKHVFAIQNVGKLLRQATLCSGSTSGSTRPAVVTGQRPGDCRGEHPADP